MDVEVAGPEPEPAVAGIETHPVGTETVEVDTGDGLMPGTLWLPPRGVGPGLLLLQEIFGVSNYIRGRAEELAALGYVVLAPEIYWRLDHNELDESAPDVLDRALAVVGRLDWDKAVSDAAAAFNHLSALASVRDGVGAIGFCFGGGLAFNVAAVRSPDVLVSYYGSALPNLLELAPEVTARSLHHFGEADQYIAPDTVEQIRRAVTARPDTEFWTYPGAGHAFDNPMPAFHHPEAAALAWRRTTAFLTTHLPVHS